MRDDLEQALGERGVPVDHSTIYRWVQKFAPEMEKRLRWEIQVMSDYFPTVVTRLKN